MPFEYFGTHLSIESFPFSLDDMTATMKFVYPDMIEMDSIQSMTNVNLRHSNTKKFKKFRRQVKNIEKDWYGNSTYSVSGMFNKICKYHILLKSM